jgi:hypothetical protein
MEHSLQIVLALVVIVLGACLVPLLLQLYRTAKALETLAESARTDLGQIAQDVHHTRLALDRVTGIVERSLEFPASASAIGVGLMRSVAAFLERGPSPLMEALVTAVKIGIHFFRRAPAAAPEKEARHE